MPRPKDNFGYFCTCPVCKEKFLVVDSTSWGWKCGSKKVCSYHCKRKLETTQNDVNF